MLFPKMLFFFKIFGFSEKSEKKFLTKFHRKRQRQENLRQQIQAIEDEFWLSEGDSNNELEIIGSEKSPNTLDMNGFRQIHSKNWEIYRKTNREIEEKFLSSLINPETTKSNLEEYADKVSKVFEQNENNLPQQMQRQQYQQQSQQKRKLSTSIDLPAATCTEAGNICVGTDTPVYLAPLVPTPIECSMGICSVEECCEGKRIFVGDHLNSQPFPALPHPAPPKPPFISSKSPTKIRLRCEATSPCNSFTGHIQHQGHLEFLKDCTRLNFLSSGDGQSAAFQIICSENSGIII